MQGIDTLIKMHQRELDTLRRELVIQEEKKEQLIQVATKLHHELLQERELAAENPVGMAQYMAGYEKRMQQRQLDIAQEVILIEQELGKLSAAIAERFSELKKYEITRDNQIAREKAAEAGREQAVMDEVGLQQFSRREDEKKS